MKSMAAGGFKGLLSSPSVVNEITDLDLCTEDKNSKIVDHNFTQTLFNVMPKALLMLRTLPQCASSTEKSDRVRPCETTVTNIPERKREKRARMKRTGESEERWRLPDILSITIIGFST